jgi:hypothetical protein
MGISTTFGSEPDDDITIDVKVQKIEQLFHTLDPYPFRERGLGEDAERYIVDFAKECARSGQLRIVLHIPAEAAAAEESLGLPEAISNHFQERAEGAARELRELFRTGRTAAVIGISILILLAAAVELVLVPAFGDAQRWLAESLLILAWVANWKPLQIFLYDWWPIARRRRLYRRLAAADVSLRPT